MNAIDIKGPVTTNKLSPGEAKNMARVVEALKTWDHHAARQPWTSLVQSRVRSVGILDDLEIKLLIWQAIQKACLACASRGQAEYLRLVEDLSSQAPEPDLGMLESQNVLDKEHQLAQMVFTISKILYEAAREAM